ncbi:hypothetical protein E1202_01360 [Saccharopolyspora karakumensis]|uniref:Uncharacterized protein n=1 Tax=Saccharopolyspora karakumensis TaxID=2530386 RepID=A0A4V2YYC7_9PSEU|nr:hypothetical protein [Saccharopolyspora karakumensis]TDD92667.1 hypothetical protein E1202_01360 [Saccharopolyspora karakumensis]
MVQLILVLIGALLVTALARSREIAAPLLLVAVGLAVSLVPGGRQGAGHGRAPGPGGRRAGGAHSGERADTSARTLSELRRNIIAVQRSAIADERDAGHLDDEVLRRVLRELDLQEAALEGSWRNR